MCAELSSRDFRGECGWSSCDGGAARLGIFAGTSEAEVSMKDSPQPGLINIANCQGVRNTDSLPVRIEV